MIQAIRDYFFRISEYGLVTVVLELMVIGLVVYAAMRFLQGTRGLRLLEGLVVILVLLFLVVKVAADWLHLERLNVLYTPVITLVVFGAIIVFQPELRRALIRMGETRWLRHLFGPTEQLIEPLIRSVTYLSKNKIGALIAIERQVGLAALAETGVRLDAQITAELLNSIFWPGSALHDLGVIIRQGRVAAAGCQFPMTQSSHVARELGSRHRAGIGLSEDSDAAVVIISEETGTISLAVGGQLIRALTPQALHSKLRNLLSDNERQEQQS